MSQVQIYVNSTGYISCSKPRFIEHLDVPELPPN